MSDDRTLKPSQQATEEQTCVGCCSTREKNKNMRGKGKGTRTSVKSRNKKQRGGRLKKPKSKLHVWRGTCPMTGGGLKKDDIIRKQTAKGFRYVSKKKSEAARNHPWILAVSEARRQLNMEGFTPVKKGTALYDKAKAIMAQK